MAESVIGLYKTELIRRRGPWRTVDDLELGSLTYIDWFNQRRLHPSIGDVPPAELEALWRLFGLMGGVGRENGAAERVASPANDLGGIGVRANPLPGASPLASDDDANGNYELVTGRGREEVSSANINQGG